MQGQKKRNAIIGYFQKRDSLTFLGDLDNLDARSTARRNSKEGTDLLSVLANPVNIRKTSAPPLNRQISLSSMKVLIRIFNSASKSFIRRFVITEKAPTRAFFWLKAATTAFTFKTLLRHYAKRALTPRSLNVKLGPRCKGHKGRAVWLA